MKLSNIFTGRINRRSYVIGLVAFYVLFYFLLILNPLLNSSVPGYFYLFITAMAILGVGLIIRRLHDIGLAEYWVLPYVVLTILPFFKTFTEYNEVLTDLNGLASLFLVFMPGQRKQNKYGAVPENKTNLGSLFG